MRPFVDFIHHQPPLHLYLLAPFGKWFGDSLAGYRILSAVSIAGSALVLFFFVRRFAGTVPALFAQAVFLFSPAQIYTLCVLPETPTAVFTLLGAAFLFAGRGAASAYAAGAAFTAALLIKATSGVVIFAATVSLVYARNWRRLGHFAAGGILSAVLGFAWLLSISDGEFAEVLRVQATRAATRSSGMWSVPSGFEDMRRSVGAETRLEWALHCFKEFFRYPDSRLPLALFAASMAAAPVWVLGIARGNRALQAFCVAWPLAYVALNFFLIDFVAAEKFTPFLAFSAFSIAGLAWFVQRLAGAPATAVIALGLCVPLAMHFTQSLRDRRDPEYFRHARRFMRKHPVAVSFTPMLFAVTGTEPGCGLWNPINTYGRFAEAVGTDRTRRLRRSDEQLVACLKENPRAVAVVDWGFYFYTVPGSPLREYLGGEGRRQRAFFSSEAREQWDAPVFTLPMDR
jgi:4-amino-4-deoxy-L-arabinose transferase-like glycosyltransferase